MLGLASAHCVVDDKPGQFCVRQRLLSDLADISVDHIEMPYSTTATIGQASNL